MRSASSRPWQVSELLITVSVFIVLVWYAYGILLVAPYPGFSFNPTNGRVDEIHTDDETESTLYIGDYVLQIGDVTFDEYLRDTRVTFFEGAKAGDLVEITVERDGQELLIPWKFVGFDRHTFISRFFNVWMLAFVFWLAGLAGQLVIRPKGPRRTLFVAATYLTALWLIFGSLSSRHLWGSSILLHATTWLLLPVYLHLHWMFPRPLKILPKAFWVVMYLLGVSLAAAEIFQLPPKSLYALGFLLAMIGSIVLQALHYIRQPDQRRSVGILAFSILIAFAPSILLGILIISGAAPAIAPLGLFAMPFMPLMYFYVIYIHQSGGLKLRLNRLVSLYAFFILLGILLFLPVIPVTRILISHEAWIFIAMVVAALTGVLAILFFPRFEAFINQRFLGIKLPYQHLPETYSSRITTSTSLPSLLTLLEDEVFPSLLIRQYAFLQVNDKTLTPLLAKDTPDSSFEVDTLTQKAGEYIPTLPSPADWLRLILPLRVGDKTLGFWLLGRRDPDDLYPQAEIPVLQSLADQTAIALSNILQTDRILAIYEANIDRVEKERKRVARDLHDRVLNQLAAMRNSLDQQTLPAEFLSRYEGLKQHVREIISDLRPLVLDQGLIHAITELTEDLQEEAPSIKVELNLQASGDGIAEKVETHLFFIVREACTNALKHAQANTLSISGIITPESVDLSIQDNGKGFDIDLQKDIHTLQEAEHFGLAGMIERAQLIDADLHVHSKAGNGTKIHILWRAK